MKRTGKNILYQGITEKAFQNQVIQLAETLGYLVYHVPDSRRVTSRGFLDIVLLHPTKHRLLFRELKTEKGRLRPEQAIWLNGLIACGCDASVWRPSDWDMIVKELSA